MLALIKGRVQHNRTHDLGHIALGFLPSELGRIDQDLGLKIIRQAPHQLARDIVGRAWVVCQSVQDFFALRHRGFIRSRQGLTKQRLLAKLVTPPVKGELIRTFRAVRAPAEGPTRKSLGYGDHIVLLIDVVRSQRV